MNLRVETWYVMGKEFAKCSSKPLLGFRISYKKFKLWVPLKQDRNHCHLSQIPHNVMYAYTNMTLQGLNWKRLFFEDEPIHRWQADNESEVTTEYYRDIEDFKECHSEYFI